MRLSSSTLFLVVLCVGAVAGTTASYDGYTWTATNGAFVVSSVEFSSRWGLPWGPGNVVDIVIRGTSNKIITAGTTKFNLWEDEVPKFEDNGFAPYFVCNNKGCDPSDPESLHLEDPTVEPTAFAVAVSFTMTRAQKTGMFSMDIWGVDQDHSPYDFSVSIDYNYTYGADNALPLPMPAATTPQALRGSAAPAPQVLPLPIDYNVTSGAFAVTGVSASAPDGRWTPGETATVTVRGEILDKHILAGTAKFKLYEFGITHFVASGNSPYFHCTNKGCDPSEPIALRLQNPNGLPTSFTLDVTFVVPNTQPGGTNTFLMDLWGVDQDHYPYDFDSSIRFHTSV